MSAPTLEEELSSQFPIKVEERPGRGRCVIAKENIAAGAVVMQAAPVAWMALPLAQVCWACLRAPSAGKATLSRCGGCDLFRYCDRACQKADWGASHKAECKLLRAFFAALGPTGERLDSTDLASALLLHRVLRSSWVRSTDVPGPAFIRGPGASPVYIHSLADVARMERETRAPQLQAVHAVVKLAQRMGLLASLPIPPELAGLGGSIQDVAAAVAAAFDRNNFGVTDDLLASVGMGVFPAGALLNHSCAPNACVSYEWLSSSPPGAPPRPAMLQVIRALVPIPAGAEICHTFTEIARPVAERRKHLESIYGFSCDCEACSAESSDGVSPLVASAAAAGAAVEVVEPRLSGADPLSEEEGKTRLSSFVRVCQERLRLAGAAGAALCPSLAASGKAPPSVGYGETLPAIVDSAITLVQLIESRATSAPILGVGASAGFRAPSDVELAAAQGGAGASPSTRGLLLSGVLPRVTGDDAAEVTAEISALEACLAVLRWDVSVSHLDAVQVAQALLSRYLLMDDLLAATAAAAYLAEWYETAYPRTPSHPMRALQMFTAADLLVEVSGRAAPVAAPPPQKPAAGAAKKKKPTAAGAAEEPEPVETFVSVHRLVFLRDTLFPSRAAAAALAVAGGDEPLAADAWRKSVLLAARSIYEGCRRILAVSRGPQCELASAASDKLREVSLAMAAAGAKQA